MPTNRISLVEFGHFGHHADYLRHLVGAWRADPAAGLALQVTVTPAFLNAHPDVVNLIYGKRQSGVDLDVIQPDRETELRLARRPDRMPLTWLVGDGPPQDTFSRKAWDLAQAAALKFRADHLVLMEIDPVLPALAARLPSSSFVSGIWFKPAGPGDGRAARQWALHQGVLLKRALSHPRLLRILCLDPDATEELRNRTGSIQVCYLPDPVAEAHHSTPAARMILRSQLGISPDRISLLFFGQLAARKGLLELLRHIAALSAEDRARVSLAIAGPAFDIDRKLLSQAIAQLRESAVQVILRVEFVPDDVAASFFEASDAVLVPYLNHAGMSGVMLRAAAHARPVLAQSSGLMGRLVQRHRLGLTVDVLDRAAFHAALHKLFIRDLGGSFHKDSALAFAGAHGIGAFCETFYQSLGLSNWNAADAAGQSSQA
jgi:glycosyltransferase involved in cell wall biosynthesis